MPRKTSTMLYRPFLHDAWRLTWERKGLWIFAIFAAIVSTGGVMDVVWRSLSRADQTETLLENLADTSFVGYRLMESYLTQMAVLGPSRVSALLIATTLGIILLVCLAVLSQGALIRGIATKKPASLHTLREQATSHFWSLFVIGAINKILMMILVMLMTLPIWLIAVSASQTHALIFFLLMLLFIPAVIVVNMVYMFAVLDIVEQDAPVLDAIMTGVRVVKKQWLATFEFGLMLFLIVLGAGLLAAAAFSVLLIPFSLLFSAFLVTGSFPLFMSINVLGLLVMLLYIATFGGAAVTFQYAAWYQFYKKALHRSHGKKLFSRILRMFKR